MTTSPEQIIYARLTQSLSTSATVFHAGAPLGTQYPFVRFDDVVSAVEYVKGPNGLDVAFDRHELTIDAVSDKSLTAITLRNAARKSLECGTFESQGLELDDFRVQRADIQWDDAAQGFDAQVILTYTSQYVGEDGDDDDDTTTE